MGSGGDNRCAGCRKSPAKCECLPEADGELFAAQRWASLEVAKRWPKGSVVVERTVARKPHYGINPYWCPCFDCLMKYTQETEFLLMDKRKETDEKTN